MADEKPGDWSVDATLRTEDYFNRHLDGKQSPDDAELEPELQSLLTKVYERQRKDAFGLLDGATGRLNPDGEDRETLQTHKDEFREDYHKQCQGFAEERDRRIREHYKAKAILADMRAEEKQLQIDPDEPKLSR
jgi:hypothetical protein